MLSVLLPNKIQTTITGVGSKIGTETEDKMTKIGLFSQKIRKWHFICSFVMKQMNSLHDGKAETNKPALKSCNCLYFRVCPGTPAPGIYLHPKYKKNIKVSLYSPTDWCTSTEPSSSEQTSTSSIWCPRSLCSPSFCTASPGGPGDPDPWPTHVSCSLYHRLCTKKKNRINQ